MKFKSSVLILAALFSSAFLSGCASSPENTAAPSVQQQSAIKLEARNWDA